MSLTTIQTLAISIITIVGLVVLIALHDVTQAVGVPVMVALAGVHIGAAIPTGIKSDTSTKNPL